MTNIGPEYNKAFSPLLYKCMHFHHCMSGRDILDLGRLKLSQITFYYTERMFLESMISVFRFCLGQILLVN